MRKLIRIILSLIFLICIGCIKKYKFTSKVCNGRLYAEVFNINPAGVDETYLTDSINFEIYIGKYDNEHEKFSIVCLGDSIQILKLKEETYGNKMKIIGSRTLSLSDLEAKKIQSKEPLFEFK
jgi:hypothetical protein